MDLTSFLVWLDGADLALEGELLPTEGPMLPSQEVMVVDGKVYIAVNNGWAWGQEVGRVGCWNLEEDTYEEWDLGEGAENPVALHVLDGDLFTVNNGDWSSTSVTRASLADLSSSETVALEGVSVGCNASAFVDTKLAVQISGENGLRLLDGPSMIWEEGAVLNADAPSAYSLITHPTYGWTCAGVTDYVTFGEIQIRTAQGELLSTVPVGVSPGSLAWRSSEVSNLEAWPFPRPSQVWKVNGTVLVGKPGMSFLACLPYASSEQPMAKSKRPFKSRTDCRWSAQKSLANRPGFFVRRDLRLLNHPLARRSSFVV